MVQPVMLMAWCVACRNPLRKSTPEGGFLRVKVGYILPGVLIFVCEAWWLREMWDLLLAWFSLPGQPR